MRFGGYLADVHTRLPFENGS